MELIHLLNRRCADNKDNIGVFCFSISIFVFLVNYVPTDIQLHLEHVEKINRNEATYPPNFLFYLVVNFLSAFSNIRDLLVGVTVLLLSFATTAKYVITKGIFQQFDFGFQYSRSQVIVLSLALFFCFAIPDFYGIFVLKKMYLGRMPSTVWHNSTTIVLFPFAILLFLNQLRVFASLRTELPIWSIISASFLVIVCTLIKPSFTFVYIPITFVMILWKKAPLKISLLNAVPALIGGLVAVVQFVLIYSFQTGSFQNEPSGLRFSYPFEILSYWIPLWYIPISIFLSLVFPIMTLVLFKEVWKFEPFVYSFLLTVTGFLISAFVIESGPRNAHGNFIWQNIICAYLLILSSVAFWAPKFLSQEKRSWKLFVLFAALGLHAFSGILYLIKIAITKSYA